MSRYFAHIFFVALFSAICGTSAKAASPLKLTISVEPLIAPISIPLEMTVIVRNETRSVAELPSFVAARLTDSTGRVTLVSRNSNLYTSLERVSVAADEEIEVPLPISAVLDGNPFVPTALSPGKYRLDLLFFSEPSRNLTDRPFDSRLEPIGADAVATAHFEIMEPAGEDAIVWAEILKMSKGHWFSAIPMDDKTKLADWVWTKHPSSQYAPFIALHRSFFSTEEEISHVEEAVSRLSDRPQLRDDLALTLGRALTVASSKLHDENPLQAAAMSRKAELVFMDLANSSNSVIRENAKRELLLRKSTP